jgi:hypothetical protein
MIVIRAITITFSLSNEIAGMFQSVIEECCEPEWDGRLKPHDMRAVQHTYRYSRRSCNSRVYCSSDTGAFTASL